MAQKPHFDNIAEAVREFFFARNKIKNSTTRCVVSAVDHPGFRPHKDEFVSFWSPVCDKVIFRPFHTYAGRLADSGAYKQSGAHIPCVQLWERFSISPSGLVNACFNDWGDKDLVGDLGMQGTTIADIWQSDIFNRIRQNSLNTPSLKCCRDCSGASLSSWGTDGYQYWVRDLLNEPAKGTPI